MVHHPKNGAAIGNLVIDGGASRDEDRGGGALIIEFTYAPFADAIDRGWARCAAYFGVVLARQLLMGGVHQALWDLYVDYQ